MTSGASPARPELQSYQSAIVADARTLVTELRAALGPRLVALLGGVTETRAVHQWADRSTQLDDTTTEARLRLAYQLLKLITKRDSDAVAQAWFTGLNPKIDDLSPARLVRDGDLDEVAPRLLVAARAFAATGA